MQSTVSTIAEFVLVNPSGFISGKKTIFPSLWPDRLHLFHARAAMLKETTPKPYLRAPITLHIAPVELFFDIQVDPLRDICLRRG